MQTQDSAAISPWHYLCRSRRCDERRHLSCNCLSSATFGLINFRQRMMAGSFWDKSNFDLADPLNAGIWSKSPTLQRAIQPPETLVGDGSVGPQQAMLEEDAPLGVSASEVLPWVPDLVGTAFRESGIMVVGSAYAGFIKEYSRRGCCMPLDTYRVAASRSDGSEVFQQEFLSMVVAPDQAYYGPIAQLLSSASILGNEVLFTDLCPNSLVMRQNGNGHRRDCSKQPCKDRAPVFCKYAEHPEVMDWQWQRLQSNPTGVIIALGHLAEHGILRLFLRNKATITCGDRIFQDVCGTSPHSWVDSYAHRECRLSFWLEERTWWTIEAGQKEFFLLPVYHPSGFSNYDPSYSGTIDVLKELIRHVQR